jgi:hypothetical protein
MANEMLTLADFGDNLNGFGAQSAEQLNELNKALGTGTTGDAYGSYADGSALRPESLEGTLKVLTATEKHVKFWKDISKLPAYNTVEEFNVMDSYGGNTSPFFVEGGLPEEEDSNYERKTALVKFLGTTRVITHPMTLVKTATIGGDIVAREARNGTLWLIQQLERALFFADSAMNSLAFDGIMKQITGTRGTDNIIDLKGAPLSEKVLEDAANMVYENYGTPSKLYATPKTLKDLSNIMFPRQRTGFPANDGYMGVPVNGFRSNTGDFSFEPNLFLRPLGAPPTSGRDGAPGTPTWDATTPLADGVSSTGVGLKAGTYSYKVTAVNAKGESVATDASTVAVTANHAVTIKFARVTSPQAKSYRIYRDNADGVHAFMVEVADPGTGTDVTVVDKNDNIPGTDTAFLLDLNGEQSMSFKQLAPLMKLPLARISAAERFMILLYGMPLVYAPKRNVVFKNIGRFVEA